MSQALLSIDPLTEISIANSIWYREGFSVKQPFIDVNQNYFDAMVKSLDFSKPNAADIINNWCAEKTKDRIKEIVDNPIPGNVVMYLINALYFKSNWQYQFDKTKTQQVAFTKTDNQQKMVNMMMQQSVTLPFYADQYLTCVEMPYGNQAFSMVAILPAYNTNIEQLINHLDYNTWKNIVANLHERDIMLGLPRFKVECEMTLNDPLKNVGMNRIFMGGLANIADGPLAVSNVKQKTFVEVNEEGTEAAAVTSIEINFTSSMSLSFYANRPFLYLIKEKSTGAILFIGRMDEPQE
jgi:serpin B